jgi:putative DNA primase/helicase
VSGGLEVIDHDGGQFEQWKQLVEAQAPGLLDRLTVIKTPRDSGGYHIVYRCSGITIPGNTKLAEETITDEATGKPKRRTLIETRGEGGYVVTLGSPPACHPSGRPYAHIAGPPLTQITQLAAEERDILLASARALDQCGEEVRPEVKAGPPRGGLRPGDDYDQRGPDWEAILKPHGWEAVRQDGAVTFWRRCGKGGGCWSATTGFCRGKGGADLLYVFSSNARPFEPGQAYGRFVAHTLLEHGGDFSAAAKAIAAQGYGEQQPEGRDAGPGDTRQAADGCNLTDVGNAQRLVQRHGADLRYCHPWHKWLIWTGSHWSLDDEGEVCRRAKHTVAALYRETTQAMLRLGQAPEGQ